METIASDIEEARIRMTRAGLYSASGVVLKRQISPEGDISADLFLKGFGKTAAVAKGAGRGSVRLGGGTEPLVWGTFNLRKGKGRFVISSIDIKHDCLKLKTNEKSLRTAFSWVKLLLRYLEEGRTDDKVLSCFYWSVLLLDDGVPAEIVNFRFVWRWLNIWGIAPALLDEILIFAAKSDHGIIKKIKESNDQKHLDQLRTAAERIIPIFDNMA